MSTRIRQIRLDRLVPHPDHPNRISRRTFAKLVRNMDRTGRYEPLVIRPCPGRSGFFQILNGHQRCEALRTLGRRTADVVVWEVDDTEADLLLSTLNRLGGRDILDKKVALLGRLSVGVTSRRLAQLLPQTRGQLERLTHAPMPAPSGPDRAFATPIVFFADDAQERLVAEALARASVGLPEGLTRAARRAAALARLARSFVDRPEPPAPGAEAR